MSESQAIPASVKNPLRIPDEIEPPHFSNALVRSEIGSALLRHFEKYGDIFIRPKEL